MTDSAVQYELYPDRGTPYSRPQRLRQALRKGAREAVTVVAALAAFAPFALLMWPGWPRTAGAVYALAYALFLLPVTSVHLWIIVEGIAMLLGKSPTVVVEILANAGDEPAGHPRRPGLLSTYSSIAWTISPFSGLALGVFGMAIRMRRPVIAAALEQERRRRQFLRDMAAAWSGIGSERVNPFTEIARPAARRSQISQAQYALR